MFDRVKRVWWSLSLRARGVRHGSLLSLNPPCYIDPGDKGYIEVGNRLSLAHNVTLSSSGGSGGRIIIGNNVAIGPNTVVLSGNHPGFRGGTIQIEDDVWIGANCVILTGVRIGRGAVIGAGSVVTKDIPPMVVAVGNPCRTVKERGT